MMGRYVDFWELTKQALDYAFEKFPNADKSSKSLLLDAYWELDCFSEVPAVLKALKDAGARTGILSNGSSGMLEAAVKSAGLSDLLDNVISVDRINRFKAMPEVYQMVVDDYRLYPRRGLVSILKPMGCRCGNGVWISHGLVQPGQPTGRISRSVARTGACRSEWIDWRRRKAGIAS